jgi:hypothetical protein
MTRCATCGVLDSRVFWSRFVEYVGVRKLWSWWSNLQVVEEFTQERPWGQSGNCNSTIVSILLKRAFTAIGTVCTRLDATIFDRQIVRMIAYDLRSG